MGLQPARGGAYRESANEFGRSTHDGLMQRGASLDYSGKDVDPMATRLEGRGKKAKQGEMRVPTVGGNACVRNKDSGFFTYLYESLNLNQLERFASCHSTRMVWFDRSTSPSHGGAPGAKARMISHIDETAISKAKQKAVRFPNPGKDGG